MRTDGEQQHAHSPEMAGKSSHKNRTCCTGLLAHVDAGKTTLAEGILYLTGRIRSLGRVDHQDAFFDNFELERERGITIFSKQAQVTLSAKENGEKEDDSRRKPKKPSEQGTGKAEAWATKQPLSLTILDTPGHVDFSAEMERTLQVLDYAVLVISGADGVQSHVETLWRLLTRYEIPVFLFVNKMDQPGTDRAALMTELIQRLDDRCVDFTLPQDSEEFQESLAMCDEDLLESYLSGDVIETNTIAQLIAARKVFPCYFGSALKLQGVEELLEGLRLYCMSPDYPEAFGARVYKISRDAQGNRLTHMKITGGTLRVKDVLTNRTIAGEDHADIPDDQSRQTNCLDDRPGHEIWEEKVNQIRIFSGADYKTVPEAPAGTICAVTGLEHTYAGEGLGSEPEGELPVLEPVLSYRIELPEGTDVHRAYRQLKQLEEEEPQLHISWEKGGAGTDASGNPAANKGAGEIHAQLMGEVQTEILQNMIRERFGLAVQFGEGSIVYRETIAAPVVGMGHFEPLRHYAEVHLLMEPAERGSGLQFDTICSADELAVNWQRLILTHLEEKRHLGVLTGSEITDMKITLVAGRAHQKHTEGGDFRQATYRAVRQGLCRAESILLEPVYSFRMEIPMEAVGRALSDIQRMYGSAGAPVPAGSAGISGRIGTESEGVSSDMMKIEGTAPVVTMRGYQSELLSYTKGRGRLFCRLKGYEECHNAQEVIDARAYDAQADLENPCGSVFCAHGAGFVVDWEDVPVYAHIADTDAYAKRPAASDTDSETEEEGDSYLSVGQGSPNSSAAAYRNPLTASANKGRAAVSVDDEELQAIFERTYGTVERERNRFLYGKKEKNRHDSGWAGYEAPKSVRSGTASRSSKKREALEECLLVDGYNIIFAWDELKELAKENLESARGRLLDLMSNYQGYRQNHLIVVFDAYRVAGHSTEVFQYHNIYVVFTKEAETADQYIEKTVREIDRKYHVTVATSDALEQVIIFGAGASRLSARGLYEELELMQKDLRENYMNALQKGGKTYFFDGKEDIGDFGEGRD